MNFQKLALVDPSQIGNAMQCNTNNNTSVLQNPIQKQLSELDREMKTVLESNINDNEKVYRYNQVLQRFLNYYGKLHEPTLDSEENTKKTNTLDEESANKIKEQVLRLTPSTLRTKANEILNRVKDSNHLSWDSKGQLLINNIPVEHSNMVDLVNDVIRSRKNTIPPLGWKDFAREIKSLNLPEELIGNRDRYNYRSEISSNNTHDVSNEDTTLSLSNPKFTSSPNKNRGKRKRRKPVKWQSF